MEEASVAPISRGRSWIDDPRAVETWLEAEDEPTGQSTAPHPVLTDGPAPTGLGERLVRELDPAASTPRFAALDRQISQASSDERQAAYRSSAVQDAIARSILAANEKLALSTALAEGSLRWGHPQGGDSTFYNYFAMQDAKGPPPDMRQMNCFELILYSAWMLGQLTPDRIVALYRVTPSNRLEHVEYADIGFSSSLPTWTAGGRAPPSPGDMVFATHPGAPEPWHVMLSLGGDSAMSLYKEPERGTPASRVKLSALTDGDLIQFGPAPWNG